MNTADCFIHPLASVTSILNESFGSTTISGDLPVYAPFLVNGPKSSPVVKFLTIYEYGFVPPDAWPVMIPSQAIGSSIVNSSGSVSVNVSVAEQFPSTETSNM